MTLDDDTRAELCEIAKKTAQDTARDALIMYQLAEYLDRKRIAAFCGISPATCDKYTRMGMPVHIIAGHKLWRKTEVISWLDQFKM